MWSHQMLRMNSIIKHSVPCWTTYILQVMEFTSQLINYLRFGGACLKLSFPVKLAVIVVGIECSECLVNYVDLTPQICGSIVGNFRDWCGRVIQFRCLNTSGVLISQTTTRLWHTEDLKMFFSCQNILIFSLYTSFSHV